jgi:hypothetical protein
MELELGAEMMNELTDAARECQITPRQFALESLESVLASRRLPKVYVPELTQGARMRGTSKARHEGVEDL